MANRTCVQVIRARGKTYHYFRPPQWGQRMQIKQFRLSDDYNEALKEAQEHLKNLKADVDPIKVNRTQHSQKERRRIYQYIKTVFTNAKWSAQRRGKSFEISLCDLEKLVEDQEYKCAVTGKIFNIDKARGANNSKPYAPSVDRIDARYGYTRDNIRLVCHAVNKAMGDWGEEVFYDLAHHARRRNKKEAPATQGC